MDSMPRERYTTKRERRIDFAVGFVGFLVVNFVLLYLLQTSVVLPLLANIVALLVLGFTRKWIAFGMLAGFGLALLIGIFFLAYVAVACYGR